MLILFCTHLMTELSIKLNENSTTPLILQQKRLVNTISVSIMNSPVSLTRSYTLT